MRHDLVSDVLYVMNNAENIGSKTCLVPASKLVKNILLVMQKSGYIGNFESTDDRKFSVELNGKINQCRAVRPRFAVKNGAFEKWEKRFLPAKNVGVLIVSTSKGVLSQKEAEEKSIGGRLVGYVY